jgi:hypothetical protein
MQILHSKNRFRYSITSTRRGVRLCVWETEGKTNSVDNSSDNSSFLFKAKHRLNSETEAKQLLRHYLDAVQA